MTRVFFVEKETGWGPPERIIASPNNNITIAVFDAEQHASPNSHKNSFRQQRKPDLRFLPKEQKQPFIITMETTTTTTVRQHPRSPTIRVVSRSSPWGSHSPLVLATIRGMNTCADVRAVLQECLATKSDDHICDSAAQYFQMCIRSSSSSSSHHDVGQPGK